MNEPKMFKCLECGEETPLEEAKEPRGVEMYLRCAHCGQVISDRDYSQRLLLEGDSE